MRAEDHKTLQVIGAAVRAARRRHGIDQATLALLAGLSRRPIYLLESGKGAVRLDSLVRILDVVGLQIVLEPKVKFGHGLSSD